MADIKFPNNPRVGDTYIDRNTLYHYQWTGDSWIAFTSGLTSAIPGPQGPTGPAAGFASTQVTYDLPGGSAARVDVDPGSPDTAKVFRFGIPAGARGDKGDVGAQGPVGPMGPQGIQGPQGTDAPIFEFAGVRHDVANSAVLDTIPVPSPYKPVVISLIYDGSDNTPDPIDPTQFRFAKSEVEMWVYAPAPYSRAITGYAALPGDKRGDWVSLGPIKPVKGDDGAQGPTGPQGNTGPKGDKGDRGDQGLTGPVGPQGFVGPQGNAGAQGIQGPAGRDGRDGLNGNSVVIQGTIPAGAWTTVKPSGVIGQMWIVAGDITDFPEGSSTKTLKQGHAVTWDGGKWIDLGTLLGPRGDQGPAGPAGTNGTNGAVGAQGPAGSQGPAGAVGPQGPAGAQGPKGDVGSQGPPGPAGSGLIGMIAMWGGQVAPVGWLECNGQSTAAYPLLSQIVGAAVPDLRGEFIRGWDHGRGVDAGRTVGSSQGDLTNPTNHTHDVPFVGTSDDPRLTSAYGSILSAPGYHQGYHDRVTAFPGNNSFYNFNIQTSNALTTGGAETRPRNIALMYIIKHD